MLVTGLFLLGFFLLIKGSDVLLKGASSVAKILDISPWVIGTVVVGIGTSIPELSINFASVFDGMNVGVGTIIGSNIFNMFVILGISAFITPIVLNPVWVKKDITLSALSIAIAAGFFVLPTLGDRSFFGITRLEGVMLFLMLLSWIWYMTRKREGENEDVTDYKVFTFFNSFLMILAGIAGVFLGGQWIVEGAEFFARFFGVSDGIIGIFIVGIGTSITELAVSIRAALSKRIGLAVGNVVGSNIFDFFGILGMVAIVKPIGFDPSLSFDLLIALIATIVFIFAIVIGKKYVLSKFEGGLMILFYILYISTLFFRTFLFL